jgi:hypothetical protein
MAVPFIHFACAQAVMSSIVPPKKSGVLTNGMSNNARDGKNGNSALLVNVTVKDYFHGHPLDGFFYREALERSGFCKDKAYFAPVKGLGIILKETLPEAWEKFSPPMSLAIIWPILANTCPLTSPIASREGLPLLGASGVLSGWRRGDDGF